MFLLQDDTSFSLVLHPTNSLENLTSHLARVKNRNTRSRQRKPTTPFPTLQTPFPRGPHWRRRKPHIHGNLSSDFSLYWILKLLMTGLMLPENSRKSHGVSPSFHPELEKKTTKSHSINRKGQQAQKCSCFVMVFCSDFRMVTFE